MHRALQSRGHGQQGFAGARLAHQRDQLDPVVEQGVEGEVLFAVARFDAPDAFAAINDRDEFRAGRIHFGRARRVWGWSPRSACSIRSGKYCLAGVQIQFAVGAETPPVSAALTGQLDHPGVEVLDEDPVVS